MFVLPVAILNTGWLPIAVVNLLFCLLAAVGSIMMAEAMNTIKGNQEWGLRIEFTTLVQSYLSREWACLARVCYHSSLVPSTPHRTVCNAL